MVKSSELVADGLKARPYAVTCKGDVRGAVPDVGRDLNHQAQEDQQLASQHQG